MLPLPSKTFENRVAPWLRIIRNKESGIIISAPRMDRLYRINQLLNSPEILAQYVPNQKDIKFILVNLKAESIEDPLDFTNALYKRFNLTLSDDALSLFDFLKVYKSQITVCILDAEELFVSRLTGLLSFFDTLIGSNKNLSLLLFSEVLPVIDKPNTSLLINGICKNIIFHPLYNKEESTHFCLYLQEYFSLKLSEKLITSIVKNCIGHTWLMTDCIRSITQVKNKNWNELLLHSSVLYKAGIILDSLPNEYVEDLTKLALEASSTFSSSSKLYLEKTGIVSFQKTPHITVPIIQEIILQRITKKEIQIDKNDALVLNDIPIDSHFSPKEKQVVQLLLNNKGSICDKDKLAHALWGKDEYEKYSEWAMYKIVKRIRKKITLLGLNPNTIKTVKGKGVIYL